MPSQHVIRTSHDRIRVHLYLRAPWRYLITGGYLISPGDNASFLLDATEDYRHKPIIKLTRARWRRVARRNAALTLPLVLLILEPRAGAVYVACGLAACLAWAAYRGVRYLATRQRYAEWVDPAAAVLCRIVAAPYRKRQARQMIQLPAGWGAGTDEDAPLESVRVRVPVSTPLSTALKAQVVQHVGARLGIPRPTGEWREAGADISVDILATPLPPREVTVAALVKHVKECAEDEVVVGRKAGGGIVTVSLSEDSPHLAVSGKAGTGKSVLARYIMAQRLARGDGGIFLDPKRFSHVRWAGKLPKDRAIYAYRVEDLHEAWLSIGAEIDRRIELPEDELDHQRRVFILAEEMNVQTKKLARYWKGLRREMIAAAKAAQADDADYDPADLDPPLTSPAIIAMQESVCMGRELRMHVMVCAQRLSASIFGGGGGDIRESFGGGRFIARWDRKLWKMLVDTIAYVACPSAPVGLWGLARGEDFDIFRVPFLSEPAALDMAMSGTVDGPVLGHRTGHRVVDVQDAREIERPLPLSTILDMLPGQDTPYALSLEGLRTASKRPGFPGHVDTDGRARLYLASDVLAWRAHRLPLSR
jgi:hypothetical protein